jgi:hypothetical protein
MGTVRVWGWTLFTLSQVLTWKMEAAAEYLPQPEGRRAAIRSPGEKLDSSVVANREVRLGLASIQGTVLRTVNHTSWGCNGHNLILDSQSVNWDIGRSLGTIFRIHQRVLVTGDNLGSYHSATRQGWPPHEPVALGTNSVWKAGAPEPVLFTKMVSWASCPTHSTLSHCSCSLTVLSLRQFLADPSGHFQRCLWSPPWTLLQPVGRSTLRLQLMCKYG